MSDPHQSLRWRGLRGRFGAFVLERHPFALGLCLRAFDDAVAGPVTIELELLGGDDPGSVDRVAEIESLRRPLREELLVKLEAVHVDGLPEPTPTVAPIERLASATESLLDDVDGFLHRETIQASLTTAERREILVGMVLTRAVDNQLKTFFLGGDVRFEGKSFQGKGFRSLGQEAIYAACIRLRRGERWREVGDDGAVRWRGDVVAPMIRDNGAALAMHAEPPMIRRILSAQMAKAGPPMDGRDLHVGDWTRGVLPPAAPLSISALTASGIAYAMRHQADTEDASDDDDTGSRVAVTFIGEGGSSLGEWHEAINLCAARRLPAIFCIQNNQTALSTPLDDQSAVRTFADKAVGYGMPAVTVDGTDPEAIAAAFAWAAERARAGRGPALIELVCLRICGHAHHDDMLYLGKEQPPSWEYPALHPGGYADPDAWDVWSAKDPLHRYAERLEAEGVIGPGDLDAWKTEAENLVTREAQAVIDAPWPDADTVGDGVVAEGAPPRRVELLEQRPGADLEPGLPPLEPGTPVDPQGATFLEAIQRGVGDALDADERVFVYGEDVGGQYGNAFLLLRPLLARHRERLVNSPLTEAGTLGVAIGAAIEGLRPIAEIQFNDFIATGFNQLVNNAAKIRYRWGMNEGVSVPMVVRLPWGGLRHAGPYHSQNTEAWFYRTPGLKLVAPSTPEDARALLRSAVEDPDPVLFYEHIALYRDPTIKQPLGDERPDALPLGRAALRRAGDDLAIISYGAYVHRALRVAERLAADGIDAAVLDLRSLVPLDEDALLRTAAHCGRVLIVHEDTRRGSLGESWAALIQERVFEFLDAPVRILAALDTPVPYAPPLERAFLPSDDEIEQAARRLAAY